MKILIVNTLYWPYRVGGAEISVQILAEGLVKEGIQVAVLTLGEKEEKVLFNGVQVWRLQLQNSYWPFESLDKNKLQKLLWHYRDRYNKGYTLKLRTILEEFSPDIIHTNNLLGFSVVLWDLASQLEIRTVHTLRDYYLQCVKTTRFKNWSTCHHQCIECWFLSKHKKRKSQQVNAVVGISNSILNNHRKEGYFNEAICSVIYNGFEASEMSKKDPYKFNQDSTIHFGYIGQISKAKGVKLLVDALSKQDSSKKWDLTIAGKVGEETKNEYSRILPAEKINFMGFVDPADFYRRINVLVVPSIWEEPFGRVVVEGLLKKKVVLGSNKGGVPELLSGNERFSFEPSLSKLSQLLNKILINKEMLNAFVFDKRQLEKFSVQESTRKYISVFEKLQKNSYK